MSRIEAIAPCDINLCKPVKHCHVKTHVLTQNKSFSLQINKPWCDCLGQVIWATVFSSEVYVSLPPPSKASPRNPRGTSTSSWCTSFIWDTSLTRKVVCSHGMGFINNLRWEKQWDLQGAVSLLEQVSLQLGWGGRRRVRLAGLTVL